jgi:2-oxoglutarate ferredoxin oxidoreductase subunit beta
MTDDGFNIGVLYRGNRRPYAPPVGGEAADLGVLEKEFEL